MPLNPINVGAAANDNTGDSLRNAFIKVNSNNTYLDGKAPNAHTHPLSELTQSGATGGQVPTWNGTAWVPATPAGSGTVTSVGLSLPNVFTVSNSPVTGAGTLTATFASQSAGTVLAAPSDSSAAPSFRSLVAADIPPLSYEASGAVSAHAALTSGAHGMSAYGSEFVALTTASAARTKLSLGTSSTLNVPATGDASIAEVVLGTDTRLTNSRTPTAHVHGAGDVTSGIFDIGRIPTGSSGSTVCIGNDARLSDPRTPVSHTHGNITNVGAIGSTANLPLITTTSGVITVGAFGSTANTFCQGNDTRLSDSRTPTAHTHALSDLTQSGATTGQVPSWNGTAWAPANVAASQNTFSTIAIAGQSSVVADATSDTLTLVAGTNVTLTTDATTDTITISAAGGSGGGGNVSGPNSGITDNALVRWDLVNTQIQNSGVTLSDTQEMAGIKSLAFNTAGGTVGLGSLTWDTTNQTLDLGIGAGAVNALLGVDSHVLGRNTSASPIVRGEVVLVNGASAGNLTVAKALGTSDSSTANTIGLAAENIPNTGAVTTGMVITSGLLRNLNTQGFTAGQLLYISTAVEGGLTNVKPAAPNHAVRVGYVVSAHPSNGIIYVAINNGYELDELHDVAYPTTPSTNDFLVYVANRWENKTPANARTALGLGTLATQSGTFSGTSSGNNSGDQTITLTGDVTGSGTGSFAATIAGNAVTYSKLQQVAALSVVGNGTSSAANASAITGTAGQVLRVNNAGNALAFGAVDLTAAGAITGTLGVTNGGTGLNVLGAADRAILSNGTTTYWGQINLASAVTGTLPVGNGGTGATTLTGYVKGTGTAALTASSTIPTSDITGTLPIANGGTGQTTQTAAFDALSPATTKGDLIVHNGTNEVRLAVGVTNGHVLTVDSTTAEGVKWAAGGAGGGGSTNVWIPAAQWIPRTTSGCGIDSREQATGNINTDELLFDQLAIEFAQAMVVMPSKYNNGTVTARFYWTASAGTASQTVILAIRGTAFGDNVALGQSYASGGTGITDAYFAANQMHVSNATAAVTIGGTPAANKAVIFEIFRDASNVNDTLTADARLLGVEIAYTAA